ncbi:MAG TPA: Clp protease N-terminal domain-containing protein, partial [Candidatus Binatia bacterium]|nr:Clp protease N-terminal domain-containing protein [Candidatus Binatia bacterium]
MFERYTEKARRVIFFARYEASQFGSPVIDTEHLLLGLLREDKRAFFWIPKAQPPDLIRQRIESSIPKRPPISTAVDLPLSRASKSVLHRGKDEAD